MGKTILEFEKQIINTLKLCGVLPETFAKDNSQLKRISLGIAVSGGADSVSLLIALCHIFNNTIPLKVITVNHYIRPDNQTCADVQFVNDLCKKLQEKGFNVSCYTAELKRGSVLELASKRKSGIEEAARILRYQEFEKFIEKEKLTYLCLAHNQNDQLETLLMRFLQGSDSVSSCGIPIKREKFIRPLLYTTRTQIEEYLNLQKQSWCTDSTNLDNNYFRNNIRNNLVPVLNKNFTGWQKSLLSGAKKAEYQAELINHTVQNVHVEYDEKKQQTTICKKDFLAQTKIVQIHVLQNAINNHIQDFRIPLAFIEDFLDCVNKSLFFKEYSDIILRVNKEEIVIEKNCKIQTDLFFSDIITQEGNYDFPFGKINVTAQNQKVVIQTENNKYELKLALPFCIRNVQPGDFVKNAESKMVKVLDVFSNWHVDSKVKDLIPVVQELSSLEQNIVCIFGSFYGFNDWIIKDYLL